MFNFLILIIYNTYSLRRKLSIPLRNSSSECPNIYRNTCRSIRNKTGATCDNIYNNKYVIKDIYNKFIIFKTFTFKYIRIVNLKKKFFLIIIFSFFLIPFFLNLLNYYLNDIKLYNLFRAFCHFTLIIFTS